MKLRAYYKKLKNGFTIIELIISIFILSVAVVGIFSAFSIMTILTSSSKDRLTAAYLSQEGLEIVRNIRDTNWLNIDTCVPGDVCPFAWLDGLDMCNNGCQADYTATSMSPWTGSDADYLNINEDGFYVYGSESSLRPKFKRKIIITPVEDAGGNPDHIIKIEVQVSWDEKSNILYPIRYAGDCGQSASNCLKVSATLYDWYKPASPPVNP